VLVLINERAAAFWHYCYIIVATTITTPIFVATYERDIVMKTFAFTDSDRIVVVKKSQGEMTVTIKLKDADKDSQKKINFMPYRLVSVLLYGTTKYYSYSCSSSSSSSTLTPLLLFTCMNLDVYESEWYNFR